MTCIQTLTPNLPPWQVFTEWMSNIAFEMTRWEGAKTTALHDKAGSWGGLISRFLFGASTAPAKPPAVKATKTAPAIVSEIVSRVRVAQGWQQMYRAFSQTPGNTLSLQACRPPAYPPSKLMLAHGLAHHQARIESPRSFTREVGGGIKKQLR